MIVHEVSATDGLVSGNFRYGVPNPRESLRTANQRAEAALERSLQRACFRLGVHHARLVRGRRVIRLRVASETCAQTQQEQQKECKGVLHRSPTVDSEFPSENP